MSMQNGTTWTWQSRAAEKRRQRDSLLPEPWRLSATAVQASLGVQQPAETKQNSLVDLDVVRRAGILTARELHITEDYTVAQLAEALQAGRLRALEVTVAYCKRAAIAQQLVSCLTEIFFTQAQARARELDALRQQGQLAGPLHGVPVSIKDSFQVRGVEATLGFVDNLGRGPSKENSCLVDVLLAQGAVLYCKTNIPQTLMTADSHNNVFGRVLNPLNTSWSAGGSSGGEGALVAFRGSPLGVGTDIAGSIRIPSLYCGLYGFKPTANRIPYGNQVSPSLPGLHTIQASAGPIGHDIESLVLFMRAVLAARPARIDGTALDVPWREAGSLFTASSAARPSRKLRFGVVPEDPFFPLHPPIRAAVRSAVHVLQRAGHTVVPLTAAEALVAQCYDVAVQMFALDRTAMDTLARSGRGGGDIGGGGGGGEPEPPVPCLATLRRAMREVAWDQVRSAGPGGGQGVQIPDTRKMQGADRLDKLAVLNVTRDEIRRRWARGVWEAKTLDAVIAPAYQNTALEHDEGGAGAYTSLMNFLDYPAINIPFGRATKADLDLADGLVVPSGSTAPVYRPETLEGVPLAIQLCTTTLRDEECLAIAKVVDACLNGHGSSTARPRM
ncbi:fatty-acid amide hydrolase [Coniella lustricola]|uniref:amidase n=1 Tax=Coniella lustricola TaxID=2025994 RepID=A0A2T2ZYC5_9PEZI|nr:fatty-acid amide hydrolase [Coniella lustricola]